MPTNEDIRLRVAEVQFRSATEAELNFWEIRRTQGLAGMRLAGFNPWRVLAAIHERQDAWRTELAANN